MTSSPNATQPRLAAVAPDTLGDRAGDAVPAEGTLVTDLDGVRAGDTAYPSRRRRTELERAERARLEARARSMAAHPAGSALRSEHDDAAENAELGEVIELAPAHREFAASRRATAGSVLDPATWQQAARAITQLRKAQ